MNRKKKGGEPGEGKRERESGIVGKEESGTWVAKKRKRKVFSSLVGRNEPNPPSGLGCEAGPF